MTPTQTKPFLALPTWAPLYPDLPHYFRNCTSVFLTCRLSEGTVAPLLPSPLEADGDFVQVVWAKTDVDAGGHRYRDMHLVSFGVPVRFGDEHARHCTLEYIDSDMGLATGRELVGWPKKLGSLVWNAGADGTHRFEAHRDGQLLVRADFTSLGDGAAPDQQDDLPAGFHEDAPFLQVRPMADGSREVLRVKLSDVAVRDSSPGTGTVELFDGPLDPLSRLGPVEVISAELLHYDLTFPHGEVVASVDATA